MINSKIIQVLVSCPGDVSDEKLTIKNICEGFSNSSPNIKFNVLDWKDYVGSYGLRSQEQLTRFFGDYDVYIGILWKRFGTKPGSINSDGKENESGTEEEFYDAIENWETSKKPKVHFFVKTFDRIVNSIDEAEQILKVFKFIEEQKKSNLNFINEFNSTKQFINKIVLLLNKTQLEKPISWDYKEVKTKILISQSESFSLPNTYIERSLSHFRFIKDKRSNPFLETLKQNLEEVVKLTKKVVLLGDAGSGKTIELKNLYSKLQKEDSPFIPIFLNFKSYTPENGIEFFLPENFDEIPDNRLFIIWDGLDEIQPIHFNTVIRQINVFAKKHKEIGILISCRTNFYELPGKNSTGTLTEFESYFIDNLEYTEVSDYYKKEHPTAKVEEFMRDVFDAQLLDIITKPFFLWLFSDIYSHENKILDNRAEIYEHFLMTRINFDENHFNGVFEIREKKKEIIILLEKVALSMEILTKNHIKESEILEVISGSEFGLLKRCTTFKKQDGEEYVWQFEHNNIQEYLAAKALSKLEYNKVIRFLSFEPGNNKLIPSWVNTLTFLFSILKSDETLFQQLLNWMLINEKEVIVKFEQEKILEEQRNTIFQGIFNYYKEFDVWISSNKFSDKELAKFGQSKVNIQFLIEELNNKENSQIIKLNAIRLIGHFYFENEKTREVIESILLKYIENNSDDRTYLSAGINALKSAGFTSNRIIKRLMSLVGHRKNQNIRSAMYKILLASNALENYVEYLIEGFELHYSKDEDREDTHYINEDMNLEECVKNIKSSRGIAKLFDYFIKSSQFEHTYKSDEIMSAVINNAIVSYPENPELFNSVLKYYRKNILNFRMNSVNFPIMFFDKTNTRKKAFYEIWNTKEDKHFNKSWSLAKLITKELMQFVIDQYNEDNLPKEQLESIYYDMKREGNEEHAEFWKFLNEQTDIEILEQKKIDYEGKRKRKQARDFNLLFNGHSFLEEIMSVFDKEGKEKFTSDELLGIRKKNHTYFDMEKHYSSVAINLLKDFNVETISREKVLTWFKDADDGEYYRVGIINKYLKNYKDLRVEKSQEVRLIEWCKKEVLNVDFRNSIEVNGNSKTYKTKAMYIWSFSLKFNINYKESILLDMLSFDSFDNDERVGMDYLVEKLDSTSIEERILENLQKGIADNSVLQNHISYILQQKVIESYPFILKELLNTERDIYYRREILDLFIKYTHNTEELKSILVKADSEIKWEIIAKLKTNNEEAFVEEYLLSELSKKNDPKEKRKISEVLVTLQNMAGLKTYVECIKEINENEIDSTRVDCLNSLTNKESICYLMELLEFSYVKVIKVDGFQSFNSYVLKALFNVALVSDKNYNKVKSKLETFMKEKKSLNEDIKYLLLSIESLEEQFYMKRTQVYTIADVKEKLKLIK